MPLRSQVGVKGWEQDLSLGGSDPPETHPATASPSLLCLGLGALWVVFVFQ